MHQVYISIGNSDDKLSQRLWCEFVNAVEEELVGLKMHGAWFSRPDAAWQNACWLVEIPEGTWRPYLRERLRTLAGEYNQDSIAWSEAETEFLSAEPVSARTVS